MLNIRLSHHLSRLTTTKSIYCLSTSTPITPPSPPTAENDKPTLPTQPFPNANKKLDDALAKTSLRFKPNPTLIPGLLKPTREEVREWMESLTVSPLGRFERLYKPKITKTPLVERVVEVDETGRSYGTGRRKTATARVWIKPCEDEKLGAKLTVNRKPMGEYFFYNDDWMLNIINVFSEAHVLGKFDMDASVKGGGHGGQSGAIRLGLARALQAMNPEFRPALKGAGMLMSDSRNVERKKPGQKKARKKFTFVKR